MQTIQNRKVCIVKIKCVVCTKVKVSSRNFRHSEKTENLAISVDFRLIQNLSMPILA